MSKENRLEKIFKKADGVTNLVGGLINLVDKVVNTPNIDDEVKVDETLLEDVKIEETPEIVKSWDKLIEQLITLKVTWEELQGLSNNPDEVAKLVPFAQRCVSVYARMTFEKMLPDFIRYIVTCGGLSNIKFL
jgi:hypothetical protein